MQAAFIGSHWQLPGTQIPAALKVKSKSISFFLKKTLRTFQVGCEPGAAARNASSIPPSRHMFRAHGHSSVGRKFRRRTLLEKGRAPGVVICSKQRGRVGGQVVGTTKVMWQVQKRGHGTALHQLQQQAMESAHAHASARHTGPSQGWSLGTAPTSVSWLDIILELHEMLPLGENWVRVQDLVYYF